MTLTLLEQTASTRNAFISALPQDHQVTVGRAFEELSLQWGIDLPAANGESSY